MSETFEDIPPISVSFKPMDWNKTGSWRTFRPVVNEEKCVSCMLCWKFCPDACIEIVMEKPKINYDYCKGCGICAEECPKEAIEMVEERLEE
jgi:2-oxoacid:acceptor oxidoreductase delta subunit (pyruvate/2-ketoisovalerate family)